MGDAPQWTTIALFEDAATNIVAAVRVLPLTDGSPRYQVHFGRLNRDGAFSPGVSVKPEVDATPVVAGLCRQAQEFVVRVKEEAARR